MILARRKFLIAAASLLAAPAIVRIDNIMPVKKVVTEAWTAIRFRFENDEIVPYIWNNKIWVMHPAFSGVKGEPVKIPELRSENILNISAGEPPLTTDEVLRKGLVRIT